MFSILVTEDITQVDIKDVDQNPYERMLCLNVMLNSMIIYNDCEHRV
jgi:hypothetical protein